MYILITKPSLQSLDGVISQPFAEPLSHLLCRCRGQAVQPGWKCRSGRREDWWSVLKGIFISPTHVPVCTRNHLTKDLTADPQLRMELLAANLTLPRTASPVRLRKRSTDLLGRLRRRNRLHTALREFRPYCTFNKMT